MSFILHNYATRSLKFILLSESYTMYVYVYLHYVLL